MGAVQQRDTLEFRAVDLARRGKGEGVNQPDASGVLVRGRVFQCVALDLGFVNRISGCRNDKSDGLVPLDVVF